MEIRLRNTEEVISEAEFRARHRDDPEEPKLLPRDLIPAVLDALGADAVLETPEPPLQKYERAARAGVVQDSLGNWLQKWSVVPWSADEIAIAEQAVRDDMAAYLVEVRTYREQILNRMSGIAAAAIINADASLQSDCIAARQRLLDITQLPAVLAATTRAELEVVVKTEYKSIIDAFPSLTSTFRRVDQ